MRRLILLAVCLLLCGFTLWGQITPTTLFNGIVGTAYFQVIDDSPACDAECTFSISSGALPDGIAVDTSADCNGNFCLSGTPTAAGTFTFTVQVVAALAPFLDTTQTYTVVIYGISGAPASSGVVGVPFSQTYTATGGANPPSYTWFLGDSTLPPGLAFNPALPATPGDTEVLSGTPTTAGVYLVPLQLSLTDPVAGYLVGFLPITVGIAATPVTITGNLPAGIVGGAYSAALVAAGGFTPATNTFSVISGTPPAGTTLSADGTLAGTLTAVGTYTFTVQVTNTLIFNGVIPPPLTTTQVYTVVVYPILAVTPLAAIAGTVNVPFSQTFTATGGAGPSTYTWSLTTSQPPPGLTLSAAGVLSGTPTTPGTYTFSPQVSSLIPTVGTAVASQAFTIVIAAVPSPTITGNLPGGTVGVPYSGALVATGGYGAGTYTVSVVDGSVPPGLAPVKHPLGPGSGGLVGTPTSAGTFTFTLQIASTEGALPVLTATEVFTVVVYPALAITTQAANSGTVGVAYSQTFTATGGAGNGGGVAVSPACQCVIVSAYAWSFASSTPPPGLTLSSAGVLSGTPTAAGAFPIYVQVLSQYPAGGAQTASQWFTVVIAATPSLTIGGSVSGGTVGVPYSAALTGSGGYGAGPYTFSLASGALPSGLTLSAAGTLSGSPTAAGTFTFTVQVTNTYPSAVASFPPLTGTQSFTVVVYPVLTITTVTANVGTVGGAYSQAFTATGGAGASTYTWSLVSGTPPPGLTLSAAGVLSGTPTAAGTFTFTVQVSSQSPNSGVQTASQGFAVAIATAPSLSIAGVLGGGTVGVPYSGTLTGFGGYGAGAYTFALASGTLPAGITLSATGTLSGTPTAAGTSNFTAQVTSTYPSTVALPPLTATQSYTVVIYPALAITLQAASSGNVGAAYSQTLTAAGGAGASSYTWSVATGAPPPGLILSPAGVLSGTPTAAGTFNFTVQVSSQVPTIGVQTASQAFSIAIAAVPSLAITGTLGAGTAGVAYSATLGATGGYGTGAYTFSLVSGTLPTGLTLSAGGVLSGTPTGAGTFTFRVQVTSTLATAVASILPLTATQSFTIVVSAVALTITGSPGSGTVGVPYLATLTSSGGYGTGTCTFALLSGTLPADITLSAGGILSGTPTAVGTSTFTVQVTSTETGQPVTATQSFTIAMGVALAPPLTITGLPDTPAPATQPALGVSAGSTYPIAIQGTITLTFVPDSGPDDPNVQFTTGGRTVTFQIPAGASQAQFTPTTPSLQTGTVAGTITLTLTLTAAGVDITPTPAPTQVLVVAKSAPAITSATVTPTSGGFNLVLVGYSTTRDMVSAAITFTPTSGVTLASDSTTVSLSQIFTTWYQSSTSAPFGSLFSLEIPFTIQNGTNPLASVSVALTNSQGTSATATADF
jgi:hypothetical protein